MDTTPLRKVHYLERKMSIIKTVESGVLLFIKVTPKSSSTAFAGKEDGYFKIRLAAAPEKGKANQALLDFLSKNLKIKKAQLSITHGLQGRKKHILIYGVSACEVEKKLRVFGV